jgi:hypothetical protein
MSNVRPQMQASREHAALLSLMAWIDEHTSGLSLPGDERHMLAVGCFDVTLEHQAAIALLHQSELPGSTLALLRVLAESLVRGLWLLHCASEAELQKFKRGKLDKSFQTLIDEFEEKVGEKNAVLSGFKKRAWNAMNGFTHTGFTQVSRRHQPGRVEANYPEHELAQALDAAGALGMVAAGQLVGMSGRPELLPLFSQRMQAYGAARTAA